MPKLLAIPLILVSLTSLPSFGQSDTTSLIADLETYLQEKRIPGAMISIVRADSILFVGGVGYANIERQEEATAQHLFRLGSISKSFTALGLYHLLQDSPYSLDTPILEVDGTIPFTNAWASEHPVRIAHLLEHTSGFEDFHLHAMYNVTDSLAPPMANMVADHQQSLHARWPPGTRKAYSNPNYILAGHLIEQLSGTSFQEYIDEHILQHIGMAASGFFFTPPKQVALAQGYQRTGQTLNPIPFATINGSSAGDFGSTATDMAAYLQVMLRADSTLFSSDDYARFETPQTSIAARNGLTFGYGLGIYAIWKHGFPFYGHGGGIDGFASRYVYSREADLGVAVAINRNGDANAVIDRILSHLLDDHSHALSARTTYPIPEALINTFSGFYEFKSPKSNLLAFSDRMLAGLSLDFETDHVVTRILLGKAKDTLYYAGNNQFYVNDEGVPSVLLIDSASQKPVLWINDTYTEQESRLKRLILFFGLLASVLLVASFALYSIVWLIWNSVRKQKRTATNHLPLLGVGVCFLLMFVGFGLTASSPKTAMTITPSALLMYISSYALVALSAYALYRCTKLSSTTGFKAYYTSTAVGALALSIYLWDIGFIGLKLWSY
ncbi:MAG: hypothetical protein RhofKO_29670 [Rhodothermales bacterium]